MIATISLVWQGKIGQLGSSYWGFCYMIRTNNSFDHQKVGSTCTVFRAELILQIQSNIMYFLFFAEDFILHESLVSLHNFWNIIAGHECWYILEYIEAGDCWIACVPLAFNGKQNIPRVGLEYIPSIWKELPNWFRLCWTEGCMSFSSPLPQLFCFSCLYSRL